MATAIFKKDVNVGYLSVNLPTIAIDQVSIAELVQWYIHIIFMITIILSGFGSILIG